jgi:hypothetical protein
LYKIKVQVKFRIYGEILQSNVRHVQSAFMEYFYSYKLRTTPKKVQGAYKLSEDFLRHNFNGKCRKIVKFLSITHSERNIRNGFVKHTVYVPPLPKDTTRIARAHHHRNWGKSHRKCLGGFGGNGEYRLDICRVTRGGAHRMHLRSL